jgi:predicted transcriptional regulator YdeE
MNDVNACGEGEACQGYYFSTDEDGVVDLIMGKPARQGAIPADGLVMRDVPAAQYAVFECSLPEIGATWRGIYCEWLPESDWLEDAAAPCFEEYAPECAKGQVPVLIYIPVLRQTV